MLFSLNIFSVVTVLALAVILFFRHRRIPAVPGPLLASFTDLWRAYHVNFGDFKSRLRELHDQHGPLVRVGPNVVSVSDPGAVSTIYTMHGEFKKADSYSTARAFVDGKEQGSILDMQDEEANTALKRAVGNAFAVKNLLDYENDVDETAAALVDKITKVRTVDLSQLFFEYQIDFVMKMAFGTPPTFLKTGRDTSIVSSRIRLNHWAQWQSLPILERLIFKNRYYNRFVKTSPPEWTRIAVQELHTHKTKDRTSGKKDLLDKYLEASEKHSDTMTPKNLLLLVTSTVSAGFDTTALTMTKIIYCLVQNPAASAKLQQEIEQAVTSGQLSCPPTYSEARKLEYLSAVIKETIRYFPFLPSLLERVVPVGGATISGTWLPAGTVVGCSAPIIHRDRHCFGQDVDSFRPERWLTDDNDRRIAMERASLGFGSGKRMCMGRHIAELELWKVIPYLLQRFKISLEDADAKLEHESNFSSFINPLSVTFEPRS